MLTIYTDGACSGNPGPAGVGVVLMNQDVVVKEISQFIGQATNNIAEYTALIVALEEARNLGAKHLDIKSDSELMVKQIKGEYAVKQEHIQQLFLKVTALMAAFDGVKITHVRRELNKHADRLSTQAISKAKRDDRPAVINGGEESPSSKE